MQRCQSVHCAYNLFVIHHFAQGGELSHVIAQFADLLGLDHLVQNRNHRNTVGIHELADKGFPCFGAEAFDAGDVVRRVTDKGLVEGNAVRWELAVGVGLGEFGFAPYRHVRGNQGAKVAVFRQDDFAIGTATEVRNYVVRFNVRHCHPFGPTSAVAVDDYVCGRLEARVVAFGPG